MYIRRPGGTIQLPFGGEEEKVVSELLQELFSRILVARDQWRACAQHGYCLDGWPAPSHTYGVCDGFEVPLL